MHDDDPVFLHSAGRHGVAEVLEVMTMPRSLDELMAYADDLADQFEAYTPSVDDQGKETQLMALRRAVYRQSLAQRELVTAVQAARDSGASWAKIGRELGTSGEAARQRYGGLVS